MDKVYLLLPPHTNADDSSIWLAAIQRDIHPIRCQNVKDYVGELPVGTKPSQLFYYGNTLHHRMLEQDGDLKLRAKELDPQWVTRVDQHHIFGRAIVPMRYGALCEMADVERKYFIKCVHEKWFKPTVCSLAEVSTKGSMLPDDMLHVQDVVEFQDEVRCWVLDGRIHTYSYYRRHGIPYRGTSIQNITQRKMWEFLVAQAAAALPPATVIDLGMLNSGRWVVIEANEPWASGIYGCDPSLCLDVILADQRP